VLVGVGVEVTFEVIAAAALLRKLAPALRVRVVNVMDLMILGPEGSHPHALTDTDFDSLFTADRPVHINFHGYPIQLKVRRRRRRRRCGVRSANAAQGLLFGRPGLERVTIEGYREEGTTTSPFDVRGCPVSPSSARS
jgi:xylulose-5-phosphate/fructose-6-phosphate phosphoketolase